MSSDVDQLIQAQYVDNHCVLRLPIALTVTEALIFRRACQQVLETHPQLTQLNLDFSQTTFIDSSGIGALVICRRLCEQRQIQLQLVEVGAQVMMALTMTDLDKVFAIQVSVPPLTETPAPAPNRPERQLLTTHPSVKSRAKRYLDIAGAIVGLGLTVLVAVPVAIAIKLDDGGPILFSQIRCSLMGRRFRIWKFRSMVVDAEALREQVQNQVQGPLFKNANDPRITRVGRFLRKTSLDEFPQFWNVLKGEMSLVGTRPPTPDELEQYDVPQWQRLDVKPGMTGEWQVNGRSNIKCFEDVIRLDLKYQQYWSFTYDIKLIFKTIWVIFSKSSGAS